MDTTSWVLAGTTVGLSIFSWRSRAALREAQQRKLHDAPRFLDVALESAPMAVILMRGAGTIIYANAEARTLFFDGQPADGKEFLALLENAPTPFRDAMMGDDDVLFTVGPEGEDDTFHFAKRSIEWDGELTIIVVRPVTRELRRQEVATWKKLLRVISHELNNSLAPISSMAHSARQAAKNPEKVHLLDGIFTTIEERTKHLSEFLANYAALARLPAPRRAHVVLAEVVKRVANAYPRVKLGELAAGTAWVDEGQAEQVLVNLIKNAQEASERDVEVDVTRVDDGLEVSVNDRGPGMTDDVLRQALLPFYSTKERGTGLGLALCREILEAHDGKIRLQNRDGGGLEVTCFFPDAARKPATQTKLTVTRT